MTDLLKSVENNRLDKGPVWVEIDAKSISQLELESWKIGVIPKECRVDKNVILYQNIENQSNPLLDAHRELLLAVAHREDEKDNISQRVAIASIAHDEGSLLFFANKGENENFIKLRDSIISEANNTIAVLGGTKFIPVKLS